ncbi:MAG: acyl-CoA dehydrogenase family protein, partial [Rhodobacteraceae bacterium]|nr:acyl-CoA dehydrogenase family protein [Paracoccaceae bacterium]
MTDQNEAVILDALDKFLISEVDPYVHDLEGRDEYPHEIVEKMKEMGLFGCIIKEEYGGLGLSTATYAKIVA